MYVKVKAQIPWWFSTSTLFETASLVHWCCELLGISLSSPPILLQDCYDYRLLYNIWIYIGSEDLNIGPQFCIYSPGLTELSLQPVNCVFKILRHNRKARQVERECFILKMIRLYCYICSWYVLCQCVGHKLKCISSSRLTHKLGRTGKTGKKGPWAWSKGFVVWVPGPPVYPWVHICMLSIDETSSSVYIDAGNGLPWWAGRILLSSKVVDKIDRQRSEKWRWSLSTFDEEVSLDPIVMW